MGAAKSTLIAYLDSDGSRPKKSRKADVGVFSIKGRKATHVDPTTGTSTWINQDTYTWFEVGSAQDPFSTIQAYLVFDGHGPHGHLVAARCAQELPKHLCDNNFNFQEAFQKMQQDLEGGDVETCDARHSGSTCIAIILDDEHRITVAGVGDSMAVLAMRKEHGVYSPSVLSVPHKPERPEERQRIEAAGGKIHAHDDPNIPEADRALLPKRVWYRNEISGINGESSSCHVCRSMVGLAMTRSLGDSLAHQQVGVICTPEVHCDYLDEGDDFIIVASDGLWDVMEPQSAVDKAQEYIMQHGHEDGLLGWCPERASQYLCSAARQLWEEHSLQAIDDITCLIIKLPER